MNGITRPNELPEPADAVAIFVLGLLGFVSFGTLGIVAYFMGRSYKVKLARGIVCRSRLADAGFILGTIGFIIFLGFVAIFLLALIGVIVISDLLFYAALLY